MSNQLKLRLHDVLYRTRGHDWDYAFLLQPPPLLGEGWYALHRRIFANVEPTPAPVLLRGALGIGTGHAFFATAFTDAKRRDYQDRPVAHYIAWLGQAADEALGESFGPGLVEAVAPALDRVFDLAPEALKNRELKPFDTVLRERFQAALVQDEVTVTCSPAPNIRWLGTIAP
jgi:hypothetical protein